jgi:hypothetical protein
MAEDIGSISVSIIGDYSKLQGDIDQAAKVAQQGGEEIAQALNQGAQGADALSGAVTMAADATAAFSARVEALVASGSTLAEALAEVGVSAQGITVGEEQAGAAAAQMATELQSIAPAAEVASAGLQQTAVAETEMATASEEAEGALSQLGHSFLALAEAFVITEGLKEFGQEALAASDSVQHATIALTALTGSAKGASLEVEELEKLGIQDGLALPSVLTAATRMQALLGASAPVPEILAHIADGAAAMNTPLETAVQAFDVMASAGTIMARQLPTIGLSLDGIAQAMNSLSGTTEATTANVKKLFAAMDQSERIEVLTTAFQKFGGIAQQTAEQTFGGQWQKLADQWEQIMRQVGDALLPVIKDLTDLISVDILPWIKGVVDGFNSLSPMTKDAVVTLGLVAAALPPLFLAMGALGLAINGVNEVLPILSGLMESLGLKAAATTAAEQAAAVATVELGTAEAAAAAEMGTVAGASATLQTALSGVSSAGAALMASPLMAVATYAALAASVLSLASAWRQYWQAREGAASQEQQSEDALLRLEVVLHRQGVDISDLKAKYDSGEISIEAYQRGLLALSQQFQAAHPIVEQHAAAIQAVLNPTEALAIKQRALSDAVDATRQRLANVTESYKENKATAEDVAKAYDAWTAATKALTGSHAAAVPVVQQLAAATRDFIDPIREYPTLLQAASEAQDALNVKIGVEADNLATAQARLHDWAADGTRSPAEVAKALDLVTAAQIKLNQTIGQAPVANFSATIEGAKEAADAITAMAPPIAAIPPYVRTVNDVLHDMGIQVSTTGDLVTSKLIAAYDELQTKTHTLDEEDAAWTKISGTLTKLSKTDLPAVLDLYDKHLAQLVAQGASEGLILDTQAKELDSIIKIKEQSGESATAQVIGLNNIKLAQQALIDNSVLWGNTLVGIQNSVLKGWENLGSAIADNIVSGGNWRDMFVKAGQDIEKMILEQLIGYAFKKLEDAILSSGDMFVKTFLSMTQSSDVLGSSLKRVGDLTVQGTNSLQAAATTMAATASSVLATAGVIAGIVGAIAGIISAIEGARTNTLLGEIEVTTRGMLNELLNRRKDAWDQHNGILDKWDMMYDMVSSKMDSAYNDYLSVLPQIYNGLVGINSTLISGFIALASNLPFGIGASGVNPLPPLGGASANSLPSVAGSKLPLAPAAVSSSVYNSSSVSTGTASVTANFTINQSSNPRDTARQIAGMLRGLSPAFTPGSS